ncbi:MAG: hypothetical protein IJ469_02550 [Candidatus Methanomethylophilaceae archaeon]|nr:hypothetical protein [Candidatus Methanomethylophilaceae archaeon]
MYSKAGGALKQVTSLPVLYNGEIRDISTLYSKKDGALVTVFSSGALIEFDSYPHRIPVMPGWQYSTDGKTWTTVEDGLNEINSPKGPYYDFSEAYLDWNNGLYLRGIGVVDETDVDYILVNYSLMDGSDVVSTSENTSDDFGLDIGTEGICLLDGPIPGTYDDPHFVWNSVSVYDTSGNVVWTYTPGSTFTGYVKAKGELGLTDYYQETGLQYGDEVSQSTGAMINSKRPGVAANAEGCTYVGSSCTSYNLTVERCDENGIWTSATALTGSSSYMRRTDTGFSLGGKAYFCGGIRGGASYETTVDVYDYAGNKTTGGSFWCNDGASFIIGDSAYVAGGYGQFSGGGSKNTVYRFNLDGTYTTATALSQARQRISAFTNGDKGYVCGGCEGATSSTNSGWYDVVDVYDSTGNRTLGTSLSLARDFPATFVNGEYGYVCGGRKSTSTYSEVVDVYDLTGTRTTGTSLSNTSQRPLSFTLGSIGRVCLMYTDSYSDVIDKYDINGNRFGSDTLSLARWHAKVFVNNHKAMVCGGNNGSDTNVVDVFTQIGETTYSAQIPITEGSVFNLNNTSGTAETSQILSFDEKVTGTIKYKAGAIETWDLSGATVAVNSYSYTITVSGITGSVPTCTKVVLEDLFKNYEVAPTVLEDWVQTVSGNDPNFTEDYSDDGDFLLYIPQSTCNIVLYGTDGSESARRDGVTVSL